MFKLDKNKLTIGIFVGLLVLTATAFIFNEQFLSENSKAACTTTQAQQTFCENYSPLATATLVKPVEFQTIFSWHRLENLQTNLNPFQIAASINNKSPPQA
jgi:hypothetical protein